MIYSRQQHAVILGRQAMIEAGGTAEQVLAREIGLAEIEAAQQRLAGHIEHTPLNRSESLSAAIGGSVYLKLETRQITGSFKVRGASNALLALDPGSRMRGVITASTGNHGRA